MCAHAQHLLTCPVCDSPPTFSREQIAFLEDLLINKACMQALLKGKSSLQPENCRDCACNLAEVVEMIRDLKSQGKME
ncbi:MAG: hypothetical protein JSV00_02030 [bacterium]|nr:MAG: hypothetical protein JSV00_02030 [bacterium]